MKRLGIVAAIAIAGCAASSQYFEPTERVQGRTLEGEKVAIYPLAVATGPVGEAKVWSRGAYEGADDQSFVHIGMDVHNTSRAPIELAAGEVELDVLVDDRGTLSGIQPLQRHTRSFAPGQIDETRLDFPLPPGISPGDVEAMRLKWKLRTEGQVYVQSTPFIEEFEPPPPYPYPYDGCGPYGCYGHGYGLGLGFGYYGPAYHGHYGHHHHGGHHHHHDGGHRHHDGGGNRTSVHVR